MQVVVKRDKPELVATAVLAVFLRQERTLPSKSVVAQLDARLDGRIRDYLDSGDFSGVLNSTALVRTGGAIQAPRLLLVGLGKPEAFTIDALRQASATAATAVRRLGVSSVALVPPAGDVEPAEVGQALTEGALLGLYTLKKYKTTSENGDKDNLRELSILASGSTMQRALESGVQRGQILAEAVNMARDLSNSPGNEVNPSYLAKQAQEIAAKTTLHCHVLDVDGIREHQMGCLLGVAQGSEQPPAFIILEHAPKGSQEKPIVLIGKGITFDSGGISIKPAANMEDMNMDAEGRLILADALAYAVQELKPACMIDLATLTGAVVVALGSQATGMMGTDKTMMDRLRAAGEYSAERVWELPLFEEYSKQIKSDFADIKNVSSGREAGSIIGGAFLKEFVGDTPWVHLDIAGTAWTRENRPYIPKGATGVGIRLLVKALEDMAEGVTQPTAKGEKSKAAAKPKAKAAAKAS